MNRLKKSFSRDLQNTLNLLGQSDLGSPITTYQQFTHHNNSSKKNPIQIITTVQPQNGSKPKLKLKSKAKAKQNSPKSTLSKRKSLVKKPKKNSSDQLSFNSILENPISSSDPNIKKMFTLFHLERSYRQKKVEKMFYLWYRKLTRKLLKMRLDQQKTQSMIQSSSIHASTQTELSGDFESNFSNFSNNDVQDFPNVVDNLPDPQLIHKVKAGSSMYNNDTKPDIISHDNSFVAVRNENIQIPNININEIQDKNLIENCFLSWKAGKVSNDVIEKTCNMASVIIEKSMSSDESHESSENAEKYINISISSDHSETNEISNQFYKSQIDENSSIKSAINFNFTDSSDSNENLFEDELNSTTLFNTNIIPQSNQSSIVKSKDTKNIESSFQKQAFATNSSKYNEPSLKNKYENLQNNFMHSISYSSQVSLDPQASQKEKYRPPPIDLKAKTLPEPTSIEYKPPEIKTKPESELKRYLRNIITKSIFESVKSAQLRNDISLPKIVIPPNIQKPWQFTNEYCELIVDVITEVIQTINLTNYTIEDFLDYLSNFFEKSHNQRNKNIFSELESSYQNKFNEFLLNYSIDFSDSLLQYQSDLVLGI